MTREHTVSIRVKPGLGEVHFSAGQHCELNLKSGETATTWANGWPIFKGQWEASLEREGLFELVRELEVEVDDATGAVKAAADETAELTAPPTATSEEGGGRSRRRREE